MGPEKALFPLVQPVSSGSAGVSARFSILPEQLAEQTEALGQAMIELVAAPVPERIEAAEAFTSKLEQVAHSFGLICEQASNPAQGINMVMAEALRKNAEEVMRFLRDLANAKGPRDALELQFRFISGQARLFSEQSAAMQREFARLFLPSAISDETGAESPAPRG